MSIPQASAIENRGCDRCHAGKPRFGIGRALLMTGVGVYAAKATNEIRSPSHQSGRDPARLVRCALPPLVTCKIPGAARITTLTADMAPMKRRQFIGFGCTALSGRIKRSAQAESLIFGLLCPNASPQ